MFEIFEIIVIAVIIIVQIIVFRKTWERINHMREVIPEDGYSVKLVPLIPANFGSHNFLSDEDVSEVGENQEENLFSSETFTSSSEIPQLFIAHTASKEFISMKDVINGWTVKNGGIPPEISQIKEYVEERLQSIEQDVHLTIPVPLYLGLMGTMFGIILGLFSMSDITVVSSAANQSVDPSVNLDDGIDKLLYGVKLAMIASFAGLSLTVLNSGWFFKRAKTEMQKRMDKFLAFLRIDFHLSYSASGMASIAQAQNNMSKFIIDFSQNLSVLDGLFKKNYDTLVYQSGLLDKLEKIDVNKFARTNIDVLTRLEETLSKFDQFNAFFEKLNDSLRAATTLTSKLDLAIERTNNFAELYENLNKTVSENGKLQRFLQDHFDKLSEHAQLMNNAIADVSITLTDSLSQLKEVAQQKISSIQQITVMQEDEISKTIDAKRTNLDHLKILPELPPILQSIKSNTGSKANNEQLVDLLKGIEYRLQILSSDIRRVSVLTNISDLIFRRKWNGNKIDQ